MARMSYHIEITYLKYVGVEETWYRYAIDVVQVYQMLQRKQFTNGSKFQGTQALNMAVEASGSSKKNGTLC